MIKKFQGASEEEAIRKAKEELGNDAIVLNMKTIKYKGLLKFFKTDIVEITASLDEPQSSEHSNLLQTVGKKDASTKEDVTKSFFQAVADEKIQFKKELDDRPMEEQNEIEKKLNSIQNLLEKQMQTPSTEPAPSIIQEQKVKEEEKEFFSYVNMVYHTLLDNEVDEKYANILIQDLEKKSTKEISLDHILANVYQRMILKLGQPSLIQETKKKPKVVFFIGPTGVGKTTTLAKIASKFQVDGMKKIAMITADTYRIAATEQLRTYANILGAPFHIIYSEDEILQMVEKLEECDYILVDTAGHSHVNEEQKREVKNLIEALPNEIEKEVFLVVSAATKYQDLIKIVDAYQDISDFKIIFTKLDETTQYGNILNLKMYSGRDLSYLTNGQNVPDDIETFNPQSLVKNLLGGHS